MRFNTFTTTSTLIVITTASIHAEAKLERNMLSLSPEVLECLQKTREVYNDDAFAPYASTIKINGENAIFNLSKTQPFCQEDEGFLYCDARRLPKAYINVQGLKEACDSYGGIFGEVDIKMSNDEFIKHFPVCFSPVCDADYKIESVVDSWAYDNSPYLSYAIPFSKISPKACDERGFDKFFIKYNKNVEAVTGTCSQLANMVDKPAWMSKHPCDRKWSPPGEPAIASVVCPVTCKTDICGEEPATEFLKSKQEVKTCEWLSTQSEEKKKKLCSREHNRRQGFPSVPSAYSACPTTCGDIM